MYTISSSELGIKVETAERNLRKVLRRVERWNAILLLDEAELFLIKRNPTELDRNALVTVFLRNMEYFGGLMFLTTNCVDDIPCTGREYGIRFQGLAEVSRVPRQNAKTRPNSSILRPLHLHYTPTLHTYTAYTSY